MGSPTFHGHSCFELAGNGSHLIIDPFLTGYPLADIGPGDVSSLDAVLLTHGHADHMGDGIDIAKANNATVVAPFELAQFCEAKGCSVHAMHIGDNFTMGVEDAAHAVDFVKPNVAIPMHWGTFDVIAANPVEFVDAVGATAEVTILKPGQRYEF